MMIAVGIYYIYKTLRALQLRSYHSLGNVKPASHVRNKVCFRTVYLGFMVD